MATSLAHRFSSHENFTTNSYKLNALQVLLLSMITVHKDAINLLND